jgi:predicted nucleotidyltransferase
LLTDAELDFIPSDAKSLSMTKILTLKARKDAKVKALHEALPAIEHALANYAHEHGGRFILFGSAVTGRLHYESDIDVLADFPRERLNDALDFAIALGAEHDLSVDALPYAHCKSDFLKRALNHSKVLG